MAKKDAEMRRIETFVKSVLLNNFNQTVDAETLRAVTKKIQITLAAANIRRNPRIARAASPDQQACGPDRHC